MVPLLIAVLGGSAVYLRKERNQRLRKTFKIKSIQAGRNYLEVNKNGVKYIRFLRDTRYNTVVRRGFVVTYDNGEIGEVKNQAGSKVVYFTDYEEIYSYSSWLDSTVDEPTRP